MNVVRDAARSNAKMIDAGYTSEQIWKILLLKVVRVEIQMKLNSVLV
jgi:hypothetical protein